MPSRDHDVDVLNGLIATTLDSFHGYAEAAKEAKNPAFAELFSKRAAGRRRLVDQMQDSVRSLGGTPEDEGTTLGAMHRQFLRLKQLAGGDDKSVVDAVEAGEDHIKAAFEEALRDSELSPSISAAIGRLFTAVKADHDEMSRLKHSLA